MAPHGGGAWRRTPNRESRRILLAVAILAAIFLFSLAGLKTAETRKLRAPRDGQFSAGRALEVLKRVVGDEVPHPVGSPANDAVRGRIIDELGEARISGLGADSLRLQRIRLVRHCKQCPRAAGRIRSAIARQRKCRRRSLPPC